MQPVGSAKGAVRPVLDSRGRDKSVATAEQHRRAALIARDEAALRQLLHPGFIYVHASGRVEARDAYIAAVLGGRNTFLGFASREVSTEAVGSVAIYRAILEVSSRLEGVPATKVFRSVGVWRETGAGWALLHWQNTTLKTAAAP